jgi:hypothetical protein
MHEGRDATHLAVVFREILDHEAHAYRRQSPVGIPHRLEAHQRFKIEGVTPSNTFTDAYVLGHVIYRVMTSESSVGNHAV